MEIACPLLRLPGALSASLLALDRQDFAVLATWQQGGQSAHADTSRSVSRLKRRARRQGGVEVLDALDGITGLFDG